MQHVGGPDAVAAALVQLPVGPADETVDGVAVLGLRQRCLVLDPAELVASVANPVGPRDQQLTAPASAHLALGVAVEHV